MNETDEKKISTPRGSPRRNTLIQELVKTKLEQSQLNTSNMKDMKFRRLISPCLKTRRQYQVRADCFQHGLHCLFEVGIHPSDAQ